MTSYPFLNMATATAKYYFWFRICWCHCLQKVKLYQQTKFRQDISIGGWDLTTSAFEMQTSAISELYFRFRSSPVHRNMHIILHQATKFGPTRSNHCRNMTSYPFLNVSAAIAKYYFRFRFFDVNDSECQNLSANQVLSRYFDWRLRYIYFRFRNTDICHIGILLPVFISTS